MLFLDPRPTPPVSLPTDVPRAGGAARRLLVALVTRWQHHRALVEWNRNLPRPPGCGHLPDRVWQRRSALLTLRASGVRQSCPNPVADAPWPYPGGP